MNTNTLLFEDIKITGVTNGEKVAWWGKKHKNASGWQRKYTFSKGISLRAKKDIIIIRETQRVIIS